MSTAGMLIADKADAGYANPVSVTAVKGLVWYGCWSSLSLHFAAFLPEVGSAGVFKGEDDLVDGVAPGLMVSSKCWPLVVVTVAGIEGLLEGVFKMFLWCPSVTVVCGEFTIKGNLGQEMALPPILETCPAQCNCDLWPLCWWFLPDQYIYIYLLHQKLFTIWRYNLIKEIVEINSKRITSIEFYLILIIYIYIYTYI